MATQGEAEEVVSAPARRAFLEMCQRFTGAPNLAVLRACRGERQWDLDASWYPVALAAAIDSARGYAVFQMRSSGYCGSGGCNFPIELWLRRADGAYASALRDDDLVTADEAAVVLGDGATELVVVNRGQAGIAAQFATVSRFRLRQTETHMTRVAHFFFREDLGSVQPILTVCAEPFSGVLSEQENC